MADNGFYTKEAIGDRIRERLKRREGGAVIEKLKEVARLRRGGQVVR